MRTDVALDNVCSGKEQVNNLVLGPKIKNESYV